MRWFSATCVIAAFLSLSACSSFREEADQYVCADTCDNTLDSAVFWCTTRANLNTFSRPKVELAFKACLAERGYVESNFLASQTTSTPPKQSAVKTKPKRTVVKKKPKRSVAKKKPERSIAAKKPKQNAAKKKPKQNTAKEKPKQNAVKKPSPAISQPPQPLPSASKEFDPQDLFEKPSGSDSSNAERR